MTHKEKSSGMQIFQQLFRRWFFVYFLLVVVFFVFFNKEPIPPRISALNYMRRVEGAIIAQIQKEQQPSRYDLEWGILYYERLVDLLGPLDSAYGNMGYCYYFLGDDEEALSMYDKAVAINPFFYTYYWDQGMIYFHCKDYQKAVMLLQKAVDTIPLTINYYIKFFDSLPSEIKKTFADRELYYLLYQAKGDQQLAYLKLAEIFLIQGEQRIADFFIEKGLMLCEELKDKTSCADKFLKLNSKTVAIRESIKEKVALHFDQGLRYSFVIDAAVADKLKKSK